MFRMQEMAFPCFKFQKFSGEYTPDPPPFMRGNVGHACGLQPLLSPSKILSHRKVPFQKMPPPLPTGKSLKKALSLGKRFRVKNYVGAGTLLIICMNSNLVPRSQPLSK
jgi:hypothetical protein